MSVSFSVSSPSKYVVFLVIVMCWEDLIPSPHHPWSIRDKKKDVTGPFPMNNTFAQGENERDVVRSVPSSQAKQIKGRGREDKEPKENLQFWKQSNRRQDQAMN